MQRHVVKAQFCRTEETKLFWLLLGNDGNKKVKRNNKMLIATACFAALARLIRETTFA